MNVSDPVADPPAMEGPAIGERKRAGIMGWDVVMILDGVLLLGVLLFSLVAALLASPDPDAPAVDGSLLYVALWLTVIFNLAIFGAVPLFWYRGTLVGGWKGVAKAVGFHSWGRSLLIGTGLGLALAAVMMGVLYLILWLGVPVPEDGPFDASIIDWPLILALSIGAGIGEELFFRGTLQRFIGVWGQAGVFALFHFANGGLIPLVVTGSLGILFGLLYKRGHSMVLLMTTHAVYDIGILGASEVFG